MTGAFEPFPSRSSFHDLRDEGPPPREKRAAEHLRANPQGDRCSRCGESVAVGPDAVACLCADCTHHLAVLAMAGYWRKKAPERECPDCEKPLYKRQRYCGGCTRKRARQRDRAKKRRTRKTPVALSPS